MAYRLNQGIGNESETVQRGLLIGLPVVAILLSFGAIARHHSPSAAANPQVIPVISSLRHNDKSGGTSGSSAPSPSTAASGANGPAAGSSGTTNDSSGQSASSGTGTTSIIGGRGGGPTGGTSSSGGTGSSGTSASDTGGTLPLDTTLTIPPVSAGTGDKSLIDTSGTSVHIN